MAPAISKRKRSPYNPFKSIGIRLPATATTSSADGIPGFANRDVTKVLEDYGIASGKSHYTSAVPVNFEDREST